MVRKKLFESCRYEAAAKYCELPCENTWYVLLHSKCRLALRVYSYLYYGCRISLQHRTVDYRYVSYTVALVVRVGTRRSTAVEQSYEVGHAGNHGQQTDEVSRSKSSANPCVIPVEPTAEVQILIPV